MPLLSILCITKCERHAGIFLQMFVETANKIGAQLVIVVDGNEVVPNVPTGVKVAFTRSKGYLESVHDEAVSLCDGTYVLRVDDDETLSPAMRVWLAEKMYLTHDHWKFPRQHLWAVVPHEGEKRHRVVLLTPQLFPDEQTRLSVKRKAVGRTHIHAGSPFGGGEAAPVALRHHKFLVKSYEERKAIAERYESIQCGCGMNGMLAFNLPEDAYKGQRVTLVEAGSGVVPWTPEWKTERVEWK